jgi:glycosyltransferase involved in cell wall biosynthesis
MMDINYHISVIIPTKNEQRSIEKCLSGIFNQSICPSEVIIVDAGSTDKTIEIAKRFPVNVMTDSYGTVGGARQIGFKAATGKLIAYTDADCVPESTWLENLARGLEEGVVAVGGGVKNMGQGTWEDSMSLALNTFLGGARSVQERVFPDRRYVKSVSGCNSMYRKSDLEKVGGFDYDLRINEDTVVNKKLLALGKILYVPDAVVCHYQNRGVRQFTKRMFTFGYGRGVNRLVDLQILPPLLALVAITFLIFYYPVFLLMFGLYLSIILAYTFSIFLETKKFVYLLSVPAVYLLEHVFYSVGFWTGSILSFNKKRHKVIPAAE